MDFDDLPKVPNSTAGWLLLIWRRMEATVEQGFRDVRADLANKADKADLVRFESEVSSLRGRVEILEEDKKASTAVRKSVFGVWKFLAAGAGCASAVAVVIEVLRTVH